jgi:diketogulonate reductase-like aldo/keto reductase
MQKEQIALMAYSPLAQGGTLRRNILNAESVKEIAKSREITSIQVLLAFVLHQNLTIAIPKASNSIHTKDNVVAASIKLTEKELKSISLEFPKPKTKMFLDII